MVAGGGGGGGGADYCLGFEELTELRLGLPGGNGETAAKGACKRGFSETIDLKLKLTTAAATADGGSCGDAAGEKLKEIVASEAAADPEKPPAPKAQVVGWPPVRSFRKNILSSVKPAASKEEDGEKHAGATAATATAAFVKVSMDGAPYLRKVDLKMYGSYQELSMALEKMFGSFTGTGNCGSQLRDFVNENKFTDLLNGSEYVPTYEDKDGDWMLVGDVPWDMFVGSCKRLRVMKGSEAVGLAPRAMEKCKNNRS